MTKQEIENVLHENIEEINLNLSSEHYLFDDEVSMYADILAILSTQKLSVNGITRVLDTVKEIVPCITHF